MTITKPMKIAAAAILAVLLIVTVIVVVQGFGPKKYRRVACAAPAVEVAQKASSPARSPSPSPKTYSPPKNATPPSKQNVNAKAPSPQHEVAHKNQATATAPAGQNTAKAKVTPPGEKSYTPPPADKRPPAKQYDKAAYEAPERVSRGGSYRSPVTNHVYVWHDPTYYASPGYRLDLFDPYNPWNYTNPYSPFFGRQYNVVEAC